MSFLLLVLAMSLSPLAEARVAKILSSSELVVAPVAPDACEPGRIYALIPQDEPAGEPIAFAETEHFMEGAGCVARVASHPKSPLVRVGDATRAVDLYHGGQDIPGRYDLVREGHRGYSARYKPLVYGGLLFGQTAATLDRGEFLAGLSPIMYGVTDRFQLDTTWPLFFARAADIGAKVKLYQNEDMKLSAYAAGTQYFRIGRNAGEVDLMFDNGSNGRSLSHTRLRYTTKIPEQVTFLTSTQAQDARVEISTVNEWMHKSWHRILFGPKFIAGDEYDLGFLFSTIFVFDRFHGAVNLNVNSVRHFDFKGYKQVVGADFFWRF